MLMEDAAGGNTLENEIINDGKADAKIYTPMNKEEFDFLRQ
jgi:hypothetical protein